SLLGVSASAKRTQEQETETWRNATRKRKDHIYIAIPLRMMGGWLHRHQGERARHSFSS
ncbi:hypothetical protein BJV74DRAFT_822456, partial [Russula compacta]